MKHIFGCALAAGILLSGSATAQTISGSLNLFVYPSDGQTPQELAVDENECYQWAQQSTGIDPNNPMAGVQVEQPQQSSGGASAGRGALGGAAKGALIGEITDNDTSDYAAAGAVLGAARGARAKRQQEAAAQQQAQANAQAQANERVETFKRAFSACMQGRSYTVN